MNLTPEWVGFLAGHEITAEHWSKLGSATSDDREIMEFARGNGFIVFTHDLDFGNILAATRAGGPSVVQVRTQDPTPERVGDLVVAALVQRKEELERGALITIEPERMRVRVLPLWQGAG